MNPTPQMTLREFVDQFYAIERPVGLKAELQLRDMVRLLGTFVGHDVTLAELDENLASRWVAWLEDRYAAETCKSKQRQLLAVWRYAADLDLVSEPRKRRIRKVRKASPLTYCWTLQEIETLLAVVPIEMSWQTWHKRNPVYSETWWRKEMVPRHYRGIEPALWWTAFIRTAFDSGLRLSDVLAITRDNISSDGILVVQQQKTGQPIVCTLSPETMQAIVATFPPEREIIFPWCKAWRQKLYKRFAELVKAAGIRKGTTKYLRRSRATYAERETPGLARRVLGHSSSDTWKRYFDVAIGTAPPPAAPRLTVRKVNEPKRIEGPQDEP